MHTKRTPKRVENQKQMCTVSESEVGNFSLANHAWLRHKWKGYTYPRYLYLAKLY